MPTPCRFQIFDSLNRLRTLATGAEAYVRLPWINTAPGAPVLILGLGPQVADIVDHLGAAGPEREVAWVESPDFERNFDVSWPENKKGGIPAHWQRLTPALAEQYLIDRRPEVWAYRQASRLFPDFWGPVLANLQGALLRGAPRAGSASGRIRPGPMLLPGTEHDLLHLELRQALSAEGFTPVVLNTDEAGVAGQTSGQALKQALQGDTPAFFLSVNLRGLDADGETFHLLQAMGVPVAIWFVDNPWHILSTLRLPWWKQARLFVTDATFIPGLKQHGAAHAFHLPLAASPLFAAQDKTPPVELPARTRIFFAGRSAFPHRHGFFAAAKLPDNAVTEASALPLSEPDFHWWTRRLGLSGALWPGQDVRRAGLGAENASLRRRTQWLKAAAPLGLALAGDEGWKDLLPPKVSLMPPVDYYAALPGLYRAAPYSLSVTSLLLPGGLTQRHFDVWQAGGFLITAPTPGLEIFPKELTTPVTLDLPYTLEDCLNAFDRQPSLRRDLQSAWKKLLLNAHSFQHRIQFLIQLLI